MPAAVQAPVAPQALLKPGRSARARALRRLVVAAGLTAALAVPVAAPAAAHSAERSVSSTTQASPTLRYGSRGPAVVALQQLLHVRPTGWFGPLTRRAVITFQTSQGLAADGVVGPQTWRVLRAAARVSRSAARTPIGELVITEAARHEGEPYVFGANGPHAFDCSGFVQYVYAQVGMVLPRTSGEQAAAARPVPLAQRRLGDLVIFRRAGRVFHVGLYAGDDTIWVARHTGTTITQQPLGSRAYTVGRFA